MDTNLDRDNERLNRYVVTNIWQQLLDFLHSVNLMFLLITALIGLVMVSLIGPELARLISEVWINLVTQLQSMDIAIRLVGSGVVLLFIGLYRSKRSSRVYLVDFSSYKPDEEQKVTAEKLLTYASDWFEPDIIEFQRKIMARSGLSNETYLPPGVLSSRPKLTVEESRFEAASAMFGSLDSLFQKTGVKPNDIDILIVNSGIFSTTPSLSSMIVNHYKLRDDIKTFNLSGMGCSASVISVDLAKNLLRIHPDSYAVIVSTEVITAGWYLGKDRSMMLINCIFRCGGAAALLSNKSKDRSRSKYELVHTVRTHKGSDERSYQCVMQKSDANGVLGVTLSRELPQIAGEALKTNIETLAPLVLPLSEKFCYFVSLIRNKISKTKVKPYIPDIKLAIDHFCIHAGGRAVLDEVEKYLKLTEWDLEPSRMSLHQFGNTSSSSLWYELAYLEAKGRIKRGDQIWQIAFGSGFKCNSSVLRALKPIIERGDRLGNPWMDSIDKYPVKVLTGSTA